MTSPPLTARSERVRAARRLTDRSARHSSGLFLAEGAQSVREALTDPDRVVEIFATPGVTGRHPELVQLCGLRSVPWREAAAPALAALSETVSPQGVVAVCRMAGSSLSDVLAHAPALVAVCASIRDPGNAGTVIRTADAAGAAGVVFAGDSVDPYNGKVVRASVGSLFHLPVVTGVSLGAACADLRAAGLQVVAADSSGTVSLHDLDTHGALSAATAWVFGNEAWGLPADDIALADVVVRVPIYGRAESLNLAAAAAVCLYASARAQHRQLGDRETGSPGGTAAS